MVYFGPQIARTGSEFWPACYQLLLVVPLTLRLLSIPCGNVLQPGLRVPPVVFKSFAGLPVPT